MLKCMGHIALKATGQCLLERYLSATMSARLVRKASSIGIRRRIQRLLLETLLVSMSFILRGMPEPLLEVWKFEGVGTAVDRDLLE